MARIGNMSERITVKRPLRVQRSDGGFDVTMTTIQTRWAQITPASARESEQAGRLHGATTYNVEVDARGADVAVDDTIVWTTGGNVELNVREVRTPRVRDMALVIVADAGVIL